MNTKPTTALIRPAGVVLLVCALLAGATWAQGGPIRIVVVPLYTVDDADENRQGHFSRVVNNQLAYAGFEVVNPSEFEETREDYDDVGWSACAKMRRSPCGS